MAKVDLYSHSDFKSFLSTVLKEFSSLRSSKVGLNTLARILRYRSPRTIGMVLNGDRLPSPQMILRLSKWLELTPEEHHFLLLLVERERQLRRKLPTQTIDDLLEQARPKSMPRHTLDEEQLHVFANWYFTVIHQLLGTPKVSPSFSELSKKLRNKVTPKEIESTIQLLVNLGMAEKTESGFRLLVPHLDTVRGVPSRERRKSMSEMFQRGIEAIEEQPPEEREMFALTLRIDKKRLGEAKEYVHRLLDDFDARFSDDKSTDVYQFNTQFFRHTQ